MWDPIGKYALQSVLALEDEYALGATTVDICVLSGGAHFKRHIQSPSSYTKQMYSLDVYI